MTVGNPELLSSSEKCRVAQPCFIVIPGTQIVELVTFDRLPDEIERTQRTGIELKTTIVHEYHCWQAQLLRFQTSERFQMQGPWGADQDQFTSVFDRYRLLTPAKVVIGAKHRHLPVSS